MTRRSLGRLVGWGLIVVLALAASPLRGATEPVVVPVAEDGVQRITLVGGSYYFEPAHLRVRVGVPVELRARRVYGLTPHNLVIRAPAWGLDIDLRLDTEPQAIRFTPEVPGRVDFYCDERLLWLPSHRDRGMVGVLEVVE